MTTPPSFFDQLTVAHWISIAQVVATAVVGAIAVVITYRVQSKQIDIAKGVKEIAHAQHETASAKLRLELFEKRFAAYQEITACIDEAFHYGGNFNYSEIAEMHSRFTKACSTVEYLFNQSLYDYLRIEVKDLLENFISTLKAEEEFKGTADEEPTAQTRRLLIQDIFTVYNELHKRVKQFLIIEKEKPLIEQDDQS